jgi:nicotinamide riboside transporter PnuC
LLTIGALVGAVLNARGKVAGFYVWIPVNIGWTIHNWRIGEFAQAAVFIAFTVIAAFGIYKWRRRQG